MQILSQIRELALGGTGADSRYQLSWAFELAAKSVHHSETNLQEFNKQARSAIQHGQIRFFSNPRDEVIGYIAWAFVADDVEARFISTGNWGMHISEWTEGGRCWIIDMAAPYGHGSNIFRAWLKDPPPNLDGIWYCRKKHGTRLIKCIAT